MKKIFTLVVLALFLFNLGFIYAHTEETFVLAEEIIKQKIPCENLTEEQLEVLGDYYMEQMHPGELHEIMDERMGGEGSESLRQVHINMGRAFYCGDNGAMPSGMMNMMMGRNIIGEGGYGMMANNFGYSMIGNFTPFGWGFGFIFMIIFWGLIIWLIVWLVMKLTKQKSETPLEILKKRFAKGEITKEEFEDMKKKL